MADATWYDDPSSGDYNGGTNWVEDSPPGTDETALFNLSNITEVYFTADATNVGGWTFDCGQTTYSFFIAGNQSLSFRQDGIRTISGHADLTVDGFLGFGTAGPSAGNARITIDNGGLLFFSESGTAGASTIDCAGRISFGGQSLAGNSTITNHAGSGGISFGGGSSAENAAITNDGSLDFTGDSTAGAATILNHADLQFFEMSSAGDATITTGANGRIWFYATSSPANAAFATDAGGLVDFSSTSGRNRDGVITAGSIAGLGNYYLGSNELAVGGNNQSTVVGGEIHDGRSNDRNGASLVDAGSGASLLKLGTGMLTLSGDNTFSGGLRLAAGTVELASIRAAGLGEVIFGEGAQTLRITNAALLDHVFANEVGWIGRGDVIDLSGLAFKPGAAATYDAATHVLTVAGGGVTDVLTLFDATGTHFAALGDHAGGTRVMLAIVGSAGADTIDAVHHPLGQASPTGGSDVILGLGGNDVLKGLGGADILAGGLGKDTLYGGHGRDCFVFQRLADSTAAAPDTIMDFSHAQGDKIDLYDLDADTRKAGNQAFVFIGGDSFAHYHALHPHVLGLVRFAGGVVQANVNANLAADFAIAVHGPATLHAGDLIL